MSNQQYVWAATVAAMKHALARHDDSSDSDNTIDKPTNRGYKLKRKARYVQAGRLNQDTAYCTKIDHNGYVRHIISRNPPRLDADGDVVDDWDAEDFAELSPAEDNPYAELKLEDILMPLTSAADLDRHPSLSRAYNSNDLEHLIKDVEVLARKEQASLWKAKQLLTKLRGDETWMPCGVLQSRHSAFASDAQLTASKEGYKPVEREIASHKGMSWISQTSTHQTINESQTGDVDDTIISIGDKSNTAVAMVAPIPVDAGRSEDQNGREEDHGETRFLTQSQESQAVSGTTGAQNIILAGSSSGAGEAEVSEINLTASEKDPAETNSNGKTESRGDGPDVYSKEDKGITVLDSNNDEADHDVPKTDDEDGADPPSHRMTTRARAQAVTSTGHSSPDGTGSPGSSALFIHPFFTVPRSSVPDKDFGLPSDEADKSRVLLMMYVNKQEEICRGINRLYDGLLRALRLRKTVQRWCKAEGHVGEMSDGEDWYDREEWGLDEDLKKGEEQEEDDGIIGPGKKTRRARAAA